MTRPERGVDDSATRMRFWKLVDIQEVDDCWPWRGETNEHGYGKFRGGNKQPGSRRRNVLAHRFSYELSAGPIPSGLCVLHTCDNRPCVNPAHLWIGTRTDNQRDMVAKGRSIACGRRKGDKR